MTAAPLLPFGPEAGQLSPFEEHFYYQGVWTWRFGRWTQQVTRGPQLMGRGDALMMYHDEPHTALASPPAYSGLWRWDGFAWQPEASYSNY